MRGKYKNKRDTGESKMVEAIRSHGISVTLMDRPADALCGYGKRTYLVEFKSGPKATYSGPQLKFLDTWQGDWTRINSVDEAIEFARKVRGE